VLYKICNENIVYCTWIVRRECGADFYWAETHRTTLFYYIEKKNDDDDWEEMDFLSNARNKQAREINLGMSIFCDFYVV
jgi:hypothetical protein